MIAKRKAPLPRMSSLFDEKPVTNVGAGHPDPAWLMKQYAARESKAMRQSNGMSGVSIKVFSGARIQKVRDAIRQHGGSATVPQICEATSIARTTVQEVVTEMMRNGALRRYSQGKLQPMIYREAKT